MHLRLRHLIWVVISVVEVAAVTWTIYEPTAASLATALGAGALLLLGIVKLARRDPVVLGRVIAAVCVLLAIVLGLAERDSHHALLVICLVGVAAVAGGAAYLGWFRVQIDELPNELLMLFERDDIVEVEGVQWVVVVDQLPQGGLPGEIAVFFQSCVAAPREVVISFGAMKAGILPRRAPMELPRSYEFTLAGGETGCLTVPFDWGEARAGQSRIHFDVSARGSTGRRLRWFHAQAIGRRRHPALDAVLLLVHLVFAGIPIFRGELFVWGGGVYVKMQVPPESQRFATTQPLGDAEWQPGPIAAAGLGL